MILQDKKILLIISGGVAAYKALELARRLMDEGASVTGVLTHGGSQFITALSVASLTGNECYTDLFSLKDEADMGHIRLSRENDLIIVAPATADLMAKMASGHANDLATTVLLATNKPVMIAPAMNLEMWGHPATQRSLETLEGDGIHIIQPGTGMMACGEIGRGRLAEVPVIVDSIRAFFAQQSGPLSGKHIVITAGPTHEPIDPVRYIANRSSGKQGFAIAASLAELGATVTLVSGPTDLATPNNVTRINVESARDMHQAVKDALPADVAICVAAVADWHVANASDSKMKKANGTLGALEFGENPDILQEVSTDPASRPALVIGFAAETNDVISNAASKRKRKGCDWIIANDVRHETGIMGGDDNQITLISDAGEDTWPRMNKRDVATKLARAISDTLTK